MAKLIYYGGEGYEYARENGQYLVRYGDEENEKQEQFDSLSLAVKFYDSIQCEKSIWDESTNDLLSCHVFENE